MRTNLLVPSALAYILSCPLFVPFVGLRRSLCPVSHSLLAVLTSCLSARSGHDACLNIYYYFFFAHLNSNPSHSLLLRTSSETCYPFSSASLPCSLIRELFRLSIIISIPNALSYIHLPSLNLYLRSSRSRRCNTLIFSSFTCQAFISCEAQSHW